MDRVPLDWSLLPEDLFYEILSWISFQSLNSCRRINNLAWRYITNESNFIALHLERTKTISGYFIQDMTKNVYSSTFVPFKGLPPSIPTISLKFLPEDTKILSSSHRGILCCESQQQHKYGLPPRYCVCNPATQQCKLLPSPKTRFRTEKVMIVGSHVDSNLHYKIVRLSANWKHHDYSICEIFDSKAWRWRRYGGLQLPYLMLDGPGVELDDVVYWIELNKPYVFAFDVKGEVWKEMALPSWSGEGERIWKKEKLVLVCGELCLARGIVKDGTSKQEIEIWKMVDGGGWQMIGHERERLSKLIHRESIRDFYTSQVLFFTGAWESIWMDLRKGEMTRVAVDKRGPTEVFKYESGIESCSLDTRIDLLL